MQWVYDYDFYNTWYEIKTYGRRPCFMDDICDDHYYTILPLYKFTNPINTWGKSNITAPDDKIFTYNKNHYGYIVARLNKKRYEVTFIATNDKNNEIFKKYTNGFIEIA
jgi:hypothetical protein